MKANKKYIAPDGYEYFMCPFTEFKVTQGEDVGTHRGTRAVDFASGTAGYRAAYYAPATVQCLWTVPSAGQAMWRTVNKVHCPNGYFGIVTFVTVHDDSFDAYAGLQVPQGNQLGNMGTKGNATGVHCHIEFIQASMSSANWYQNGYGVWTFNGTESFVDDTFYVDDTNIIYGGAGNWRKCNAGSSSSSGGSTNTGKYTVEEEHYAIRFTYDSIRIRKGTPDGEVVGYVNSGDEVEYFAKTVYNGHRWVRDKSNQWYAISGSEERGKDMWGVLIDPSEMKINQKPSKPTEPTTPQDPSDSEDEWELEQPDLAVKTISSQHGLTIENKLVDKDKYIYKCPFIMDAEYVVIHNAGSKGNPTADTLSSGMKSTDEQKSWHFSVDDTKAIQNLSLNRNGWHAGDGKEGDGNRKGIAIEICCDMYDSDGTWNSTNRTDKVDPRWNKARDNGALLAAIILNEYGWDISHLKKHQDFSDKYCPHHILNDGWSNFVEQVEGHLNAIQGNTEPSEPEQPEDKPTEPTDDGEKVNVSLFNKLLKLLVEWFERLLGK